MVVLTSTTQTQEKGPLTKQGVPCSQRTRHPSARAGAGGVTQWPQGRGHQPGCQSGHSPTSLITMVPQNPPAKLPTIPALRNNHANTAPPGGSSAPQAPEGGCGLPCRRERCCGPVAGFLHTRCVLLLPSCTPSPGRKPVGPSSSAPPQTPQPRALPSAFNGPPAAVAGPSLKPKHLQGDSGSPTWEGVRVLLRGTWKCSVNPAAGRACVASPPGITQGRLGPKPQQTR